MERRICIHAHFYQPPRENPWLETVELQDSAYPYHDWNERVTAECYAPNAVARILDEEGRIARIVNNYSRLSFNVGPTLLAWLESHEPRTYRAILDADGRSAERFSGHGSALAQAYNHIILPLANRRDKLTQVRWGIADFEHRFRRRPEGMWLPETAVDEETLDILAEHGIHFTILAPRQARRVRALGGDWQEVTGERIDPTMPYLHRLPSGRAITLFFYDGPISRAVAFEPILQSGGTFARRLMEGFDPGREHPQLLHIATDGETYGHHHKRGEMALAYALQRIDASESSRLTNYGEFLEQHPPTHEVEIIEGTSWSCEHGVGRWSRDCGCNAGGHPGWNQGWRAPLREALDWLRDAVAPAFAARCAGLLRDPWAARDDYIQVILDRSPERLASFLSRHVLSPLDEAARVEVLELLELQRYAQLMYTSCGWFFDELSGPETVQVIMYAGRVIQLARQVLGEEVETGFLERLVRARSNLPEHQDGQHIYQKWVKPAALDLAKVCAHYGISSLLERHPETSQIYCYRVEAEEVQRFEEGAARVILGCARVTSTVTTASRRLCFTVLHFGTHNVRAGVREVADEREHQELAAGVGRAMERGDIAEVVRLLDRAFTSLDHSVQSLFRDVQRSFMNQMLESTLSEDAAIYRQLYDRRAPLMRLLTEIQAPLPRAFHAAAEFVINSELRQALSRGAADRDAVMDLLENARTFKITLDEKGLAYTLTRTLEGMARAVRERPDELEPLQQLEGLVALAVELPFAVDFWSLQNTYHELSRGLFIEMLERADDGDLHAHGWAERFLALGENLGIRMSDVQESRAHTLAATLEGVLRPARIPRATYRLQFGPSFTFADAQQLIPYLDELGISDCYTSPIFLARTGSEHGYDVCDHGRINPVLGGEEGLRTLAAGLRRRSMGLLLDTVPNHMGIGDEANAWWCDVVENGPSSLFASYFDIEWSPVKPELANKVLLPILEDQYGRVLESGKLRLSFEEGAFFLNYYQMRLPLAPRTYSHILGHPLVALTDTLGEEHEQLQEYRSILTALSYLPERTEQDPEKLAERAREKEVVKRRIATLCQASDAVAAAIAQAVETFNGRPGEPHSFDLLDALIDAQAFRPAYWRVAAEEINYRRFFDINDLAAIRTEDPAVFQATHELIFRLITEGLVTGLRIDHIDGLYDPAAYLRQLQESFVYCQVRERLGQARETPPEDDLLARRVGERVDALFAERELHPHDPPSWPLYVVAEKILGEGEPLPPGWAVYGTTGYDFLGQAGGLFVDGERQGELDALYRQFTEMTTPYRQVVNATKKMTMLVSMASEIYALSHQLERIAERNRRYRDFTLNTLTFATREVIACLPVYRTYIAEPGGVSPRDQQYIETAVAEAKRRNPRTAAALFDFIEETLLLRNVEDFRPENQPLLVEWVRKFQQLTGPVMAKGAEDTAFYVYNRLTALNEVGADPSRYGGSLAAFHEARAESQRLWPHTLLASATHDTKRGEDVRARISVLSEMPDRLGEALERWRQQSAPLKAVVSGEPTPDGNDEYLLYQTLLGAWPFELLPGGEGTGAAERWHAFRERVAAYMQKATKEAKVHTSWVNPNQAYDEAVRRFVLEVLDEKSGSPLLGDLQTFAGEVAFFGVLTSLSQTLLKLTAPGVPDLYQGSELWELSLVDPDNRRPVDFARRRQLLAELKGSMEHDGEHLGLLAEGLLRQAPDARVKLFLVLQALDLRRRREPVFQGGGYASLEVTGTRASHVCAFARTHEESAILTVAPRLFFRLLGGRRELPLGEAVWRDTWLLLPEEEAGRTYRDHLTRQSVVVETLEGRTGLPLAALCAHLPVALLERL